MPADSEKISATAHYTGHAWGVLGVPHSELFATPQGKLLSAAYRYGLDLPSTLRGQRTVLMRTLHNRHRLIDGALAALDPDAVVEIAAGLSPRGVRVCAGQPVRYTEMDLGAMVALKRRLFEQRAALQLRRVVEPRWTLREMDVLSARFVPALRLALQGAERPLVIAEGLLSYFAREHQQQLLGDIASVLAELGGGTLLTDMRVMTEHNARSSRLLRLGILVATRGRPTSEGFRSHAQVDALLSGSGFDDVRQLPQLDQELPAVMSGVWQARVRGR